MNPKAEPKPKSKSMRRPSKGTARPPPAPKPSPARPAPPQTAAHRAARWELVTARDLMRKDVVTVAASDSLVEVERVLTDNRITGAPVVDARGAIVGVISVRDLVQRYSEESSARPPRESGFYGLSSDDSLEDDLESFEVPEEAGDTAADAMTPEVYGVSADAGLAEIARAMTKHKVHRLLVTHAGRYVGLVSTLEILDALSA